MNAYPLAGIAGSPWPEKDKQWRHTCALWLVAGEHSRQHRRRHIAININCTRVPHRTQNGKDQNLWHGLRCGVCSRNVIRIAVGTFFRILHRLDVRSLQMMVGSTLCARDTSHYDAIKLCRAEFVFFPDIYRCRCFRFLLTPPRLTGEIYSEARSTPNHSGLSWNGRCVVSKWIFKNGKHSMRIYFRTHTQTLAPHSMGLFTLKICRCIATTSRRKNNIRTHHIRSAGGKERRKR